MSNEQRIRRLMTQIGRVPDLIRERDQLIAAEYWSKKDAGTPVSHKTLADRYGTSETLIRNICNANKPAGETPPSPAERDLAPAS